VHHEDPPQSPSPPPQGNDTFNNNEDEGDDEEEEAPPSNKPKLPRVRAQVTKNHPLNQIFDDIQTGRITRSKTRLANFCEHYSFISSIEPLKVEKALEDVDWVNAMHEELHNFERNEVWTLVEKPEDEHNIIGTKWVFRNKKRRRRSSRTEQGMSRSPRIYTSRRYGLR